MVGLSNKKFSLDLTLEEQEAVYEYYDIDLYKVINSPLPGRDDTRPSFSTYLSSDETNLRWKDFAYKSGGVYDLVCAMEGVDFKSSVKIVREILEENYSPTSDPTKIAKKLKKEKIIWDVVPNTDFRKYELDYMALRGITKEQLQREEIYSLKMLLANGKFKDTSIAKFPKFIYNLSGDFKSWKLYSPLSDGSHPKWLSWNTRAAPYESKPQGVYEDLVILSSKKDKMVFDNLLLPFDTTNPIAEGNFSGILTELDFSLQYYRNIWALLDLDDNGGNENVYKGVERTQQMEEQSGGRIKGLYFPEKISNRLKEVGVKDIDEIYTVLGVDNLKFVIEKIFSNGRI